MLEHLDLGGLVAEAVAFLLEQPHLHRDAVVAQGLCHAFGLFRRHHFVLQTLEEQHRTADLIGMQQWRPLLVQRTRCGPFPHQAIHVARLKTVRVLSHGCEITDRIAAGAGPEHLGEAQRRQGGEAAGTATFDGDLAGIGATGLDQGLRCGGAVGHIHQAPAPVEALPVVPAKPR